MRTHLIWKVALAGLAAWVLVVGAIAQGYGGQSFPFPAGTVIQLVVPWSPGGGFDLVARIAQPSLQESLNALGGQHITVIVVNKPGAGARVGTEYVYNSPPDGTRWVLVGTDAAPLQELYLGANFHVKDFAYMGSLNYSQWGIVVRTNIGISDMKDLITRSERQPFLAGTSGAGSGDYIAWLLTQAILKQRGVAFPLNFVNFSSSTTVFASMQRGEAEGYFGSIESMLPATDGGYAKLIVVFDKTRNPYYPNVATAFQQHIADAQTITNLVGVRRMFVGPANIPDDRLKVLRRALQMALADPLLLRRAKNARVPIEYGTAEQARDAMVSHEEVLSHYQAVVEAALRGTSK
ncbi:MAG: Bug family tripartite tricarboxylate transporter substrate binding protein [bacterium]